MPTAAPPQATYCDLKGWEPETLDQFFESPIKPPLRYFSVDTSIPPWVVNHVHKCGDDVGRFQSMIAEEGVPYQVPFKEMKVGPSWAHSHFMNERQDMAVETLARNGKIVFHPAGVIGWSHPDAKEIRSLKDLYDRTERLHAARAVDMPKIRANIHNYAWVDPETGQTRNFILATGWVLPSVTRAEVIQIENAGISGVSSVVSTVGGIGVEMVTADLVRQGRATSGQLGRPSLQAAELQVASTITLVPLDLSELVPEDYEPFKEADMANSEESTEAPADEAPETPAPETPEAPTESTEDLRAAMNEMAARLEAAGIPALPEPTPEPSMEDRVAALEADLSRRAESAEVPDFAAPVFDLSEIASTHLGRLINSKYDGKGRLEFQRRLGKAAGRHSQTIRQMENGQISCPPREVLAGIGRAIGITTESMINAAKRDGCDRYG